MTPPNAARGRNVAAPSRRRLPAHADRVGAVGAGRVTT